MCNAARWSKPFLVASSILLIFSGLTRSTALAQEGFSSTTQDGALSDAPQPAQDTTQSGANDSRLTGTGSLSGTVLDTNRDVLQGARVTLAGRAGAAIQTVESGSNGQFAFTGLPPDVYKLTVTAAGMNTFHLDPDSLACRRGPYCASGNSLGCWWDHQCDRDCRKQGGTG